MLDECFLVDDDYYMDDDYQEEEDYDDDYDDGRKKGKKKCMSMEIILLQEKKYVFFQILMTPWDSSRTKAWFNFNRCKMLANIHKNKQLAKFFHIGALCFIFFLVSL